VAAVIMVCLQLLYCKAQGQRQETTYQLNVASLLTCCWGWFPTAGLHRLLRWAPCPHGFSLLLLLVPAALDVLLGCSRPRQLPGWAQQAAGWGGAPETSTIPGAGSCAAGALLPAGAQHDEHVSAYLLMDGMTAPLPGHALCRFVGTWVINNQLHACIAPPHLGPL
jgi:hypothetical protein